MYKLLLISKYLRRKLAPLFAAVAVTICTAMVIIVASVMGGFLGLMETTAKQLTPDVVIQSRSMTGFEDYEDLVERLEALPEVELATPAITISGTATFTDLNIPVTSVVTIQGIDPRAYNQIVPYDDTLLWSGSDVYELNQRVLPEELRAGVPKDEFEKVWSLKDAGQTLTLPQAMAHPAVTEAQPGMVIGVAASPAQMRLKDGSYAFDRAYVDRLVTLAMPVFSPDGQPLDVSQPRIKVVNEFKSGFYEADSSVVFVPFDWLQKHLKMQRVEQYTDFDEITGEGGELVVAEARCTHVYVKAAEGVSDAELHDACARVTDQFTAKTPGLFLDVLTWEDVHGTLLGAVKNEKGLVTFLFAIISVVAIVMVATTFYMIVLEKTRDIGVLRAIGAPSTGVLGLFLAYGLAIGWIGSSLGVWLAWFTVTNLNNLQEALATRLSTLIGTVVLAFLIALGVSILAAVINKRRDFSLGAGVLVFLGVFVVLMAGTYYSFQSIQLPVVSGYDDSFGWRMWDPQLYFFEKIPDQVDWNEVFWVWVGAVVSSVLGAVIPALIAARLNPVEALRYE
ncbi:MAG: ABC transporter permease [Phycisphaeraceae bacterium]